VSERVRLSRLTRGAALTRPFAGSGATTVVMLARGWLRLSDRHVGWRLTFEDGTTSRVYRETVSRAPRRGAPSLLVVAFRLRGVGRSRSLHAAFRAESLLNTPLFAGFPGFRSKLWLTDPDTGVYRGVYEWDGPDQATAYATTLAALLRLVCVPGTVRFVIRPGLTPDAVLRDPSALGPAARDLDERWWRVLAAAPAPP